MTMNGISHGNGPYDVVGASEGPSIGSLAPDSQSFLLRALGAHLDKLSAVLISNKDAPIEQVAYDVDASNIAGGQQYHLPSGAAIVSYYIENNSAATITISGGASGAGRLINSVPGYAYKAALMPQQVTSLSITTSSATLTGLVRVVLTSAVLGPVVGSTVGAAAQTASNTAAVTTTVVPITSAATVLPANANRVGAQLYNNTASGVNLAFGSVASAVNFSQVIAPTSPFVLSVNYKGYLSVYNPSGTTAANMIATEYT